MKKQYTWGIVILLIVFVIYLFLLFASRMGLDHRRDAEHAEYLRKARIIESEIVKHYKKFGHMPESLNDLHDIPSDSFSCSYRKFEAKLFGFYSDNFFLLPLLPKKSIIIKKKIGYNYGYNESKEEYIVQLVFPFKKKSGWTDTVFAIKIEPLPFPQKN